MNTNKKKTEKLGDSKKFSITELFSDNSGKTSASSFTGVIVTILGVIIFACMSWIKNVQLAEQSVVVIGLGSALLGVNKVMNGKPAIYEEVEEQVNKKDETSE